MPTFDEVLNKVIPPIVVIAGLLLFYKVLQEPLDRAFHAIVAIKKKITGEDQPQDLSFETLTYE